MKIIGNGWVVVTRLNTWKIEYDSTRRRSVTPFTDDYDRETVQEFFIENRGSLQQEIIPLMDDWVIYTLTGKGWKLKVNHNVVTLTSGDDKYTTICDKPDIGHIVGRLKMLTQQHLNLDRIIEILGLVECD